MDTNVLVIITGLIAAMIVWAAVNDADGKAAPTKIRWSFSESWTTSAAVIAAGAGLEIIGFDRAEILGIFGLLIVFAPLLYHGFAQSEGASAGLFMIVGTVIAWSVLAILTASGSEIFSRTADHLSLVPRMVVNTVVIFVVIAAGLSIHRVMSESASGNRLTDDGAWTLP